MAYELSSLMDRLKGKGLDLAEEAAGIVVKEVFAWVKESAAESENKYDDLLIAALSVAEPAIMEMIDKIDGEVG